MQWPPISCRYLVVQFSLADESCSETSLFLISPNSLVYNHHSSRHLCSSSFCPRLVSPCFNETTILYQRRLKNSFFVVGSWPHLTSIPKPHQFHIIWHPFMKKKNETKYERELFQFLANETWTEIPSIWVKRCGKPTVKSSSTVSWSRLST